MSTRKAEMERYMIPSPLIESTKMSFLVSMTVVDHPPWRLELYPKIPSKETYVLIMFVRIFNLKIPFWRKLMYDVC